MKKALRFDTARLDALRRDQNGYVEADAVVTRTGVFVYRHPDGSVTRELRHPDEVFKNDSLNTLRNRPATLGHPLTGKLTARNTKHHAIGSVIGDVEHDENNVKTRLQVIDEDAIEQILDEENPVREVSCGYDAEIVPENGTYNGERYDHIQKNIVYNHVALVKRGRAGHEVRLTVDSADAFQTDDAEQEFVGKCMADPKKLSEFPDEKQRAAVCYDMYSRRGDQAEEDEKTITIEVDNSSGENESTMRRALPGEDGVESIYASENESRSIKRFVFDKTAGWTLAKAKLWSENHRNDSLPPDKQKQETGNMLKIKRDAVEFKGLRLDAIDIKIDGTVEGDEKAVEIALSRCDTLAGHVRKLEGDNAKLQGRLDAMSDTGKVTAARLNDLVRERTDACGAAHFIGLKNYNGLETDEIKKLVVIKAFPDIHTDEMVQPGYIQGRYDAVIARIKQENKNMESLANLHDVSANPEMFGMGRTDEEHPRDKLLKETTDMWKPREAANA